MIDREASRLGNADALASARDALERTKLECRGTVTGAGRVGPGVRGVLEIIQPLTEAVELLLAVVEELNRETMLNDAGGASD